MKDILIVEDGEQERQRLLNLFLEAGYSTTAFESVTEAETALKQDQFRLAILDIGLGDKSGSHLFTTLRREGSVSHIIIFTGNPSVHLKQRFLNEGAVDYIVKASQQAQNDAFLMRVQEVLGEPSEHQQTGVPLEKFLSRCVTEASKQLFLDLEGGFPACNRCGNKEYTVVFDHVAQMPPEIVGLVQCNACGASMDPEIA